LKQLRVSVQAAQERRSQIELELVRKQAELKYLDETSRKELGVPAEELSAGEEAVLDEAGLAEAEQRYQEVRARIEALGPVNPQALEEFQEAQQRYDFLNAQRQDLLDSIRDTEKAIHEIDVESRKRFSEAFEGVNGFFREMFRTLFGGGVGEMRLTDETNIAESGIDIVASPPGKRLQNVLLLSGGEKSLTAMALLMAIFRYTPSPFCILDEVDAPLDEPNIERLTRLLKEMSAQTQFIVITHAKRTMEAAQSLYGVTMQEPGVSKLVSVRFGEEAPPLKPVAELAMQGAAG
jgi:chromosome segregation protein